MESGEFLLKEIEHFTESMWRNEEVGEKRFSFFVTLATAVGTGFAALGASEHIVKPSVFIEIAGWAAAVLLMLGLLTYLRMLQRNRVTDECQRTLVYIRSLLTRQYVELRTYAVPRKIERGRRYWKWLKGGYAETVGVFDGILLTAMLLLIVPLGKWIAVAAGTSLATLLWAVATIRKKETASRQGGQSFRANAGAVIADDTGGLLTLERTDIPGAWQLPQGGLEGGEEPLAAVLREIHEETGLSKADLELVAQYPGLLAYELPPDARSEKTGRGQVQYWFLFRLRGSDEHIRLSPKGEFTAFRWWSFDRVLEHAAPFRRPIYERLQKEFLGLLSKPPAIGAGEQAPGHLDHR
jgi:putative (di)nucleoside polyphosphate hydrolase